jgi:hypothetical protein
MFRGLPVKSEMSHGAMRMMGKMEEIPAPTIPRIRMKAAIFPPRGSKRLIISTVLFIFIPMTCRVPADTAIITRLRKNIMEAETAASLFSSFRFFRVQPFSATTVLLMMNTAAEQVVPVMAAIRRRVPSVFGMLGTSPPAMEETLGLSMIKTTMKQSPMRMTR